MQGNTKVRKCTYLYKVYFIYSPLTSSETAQRNSQHFTKLHNEVHNVMHNEINQSKTCFSLCFGFVIQAKFNSSHPQLSIQVISR